MTYSLYKVLTKYLKTPLNKRVSEGERGELLVLITYLIGSKPRQTLLQSRLKLGIWV